jgi:hypothetical protein
MEITSCRSESGAKIDSTQLVGEVGEHQLPEFLRLPRTGTRCPITGLSRSHLNSLILPCEQNGHKPPVKSVSLRRRGALRGVRLIATHALLEYLRREMNPLGLNQAEFDHVEVRHG